MAAQHRAEGGTHLGQQRRLDAAQHTLNEAALNGIDFFWLDPTLASQLTINKVTARNRYAAWRIGVGGDRDEQYITVSVRRTHDQGGPFFGALAVAERKRDENNVAHIKSK